jgi:uncharacterized protein (DUF885 family)
LVIGPKRVKPAFLKLERFLAGTYLKDARSTIAWRDLPNGGEWYAHEVQRHTTTRLTPQQIHNIGLREVKRIRKEMDDLIVKERLGPGFGDVWRSLLYDCQYFFTTPEDLVSEYRKLVNRVHPELHRLFRIFPETPCPVSEDASDSLPAWYEAETQHDKRLGVFKVAIGDLMLHPKWQMEALVLHEAMPGHDIQMSRKPTHLPPYRRYGEYTAFYEGWGVYAEGLGDKLGLYSDPKSKFGRLNLNIWRAIRLVVDTGIHDKGWSREKAIAYFDNNALLHRKLIESEVDRYIDEAGRNLAYKIGEMKILELRDDAQTQLGRAFDIRAFHEQLLGNGQIPLDVLESQIKVWVEAEKKR